MRNGGMMLAANSNFRHVTPVMPCQPFVQHRSSLNACGEAPGLSAPYLQRGGFRMETSMSSYSEDSSYAPGDVHPSPGGGGSGSSCGMPGAPYDAQDWSAQAAARGSVIMVPNSRPAVSRRGGGRKPKNDKLPPEEEEKRRLRRERNKLAAAKCRQRRVDHANELQQETEILESEGRRLAEDIERMRQLKEQYEFVLQSHLAVCSCDSLVVMSSMKSAAAAAAAAVAKPLSTSRAAAAVDLASLPSLSALSGASTSLKHEHCSSPGLSTASCNAAAVAAAMQRRPAAASMEAGVSSPGGGSGGGMPSAPGRLAT